MRCARFSAQRSGAIPVFPHLSVTTAHGVSLVFYNFNHVLDRLQGLPAVIASGRDVTAALATFGPEVQRSPLSADRQYFQSAMGGQRGRQYAMGRVTNVPGLFFSAPVMAGERFLGVVTIKIDLPRLAPQINNPHAFITDENGVIILAGNRSLEMQALPGAAVNRLSHRATPGTIQARQVRDPRDRGRQRRRGQCGRGRY